MLPWTVVYMTRPVLAALQTSHRCDSTRATIARGASVAHSCFISNPWIIGADLTFLSWVYVPPSHPSVSFALFPRFHAPSLPQTSPSNPFGSLMESCKLPNRARPATHCVSAFPLWIVSDATWSRYNCSFTSTLFHARQHNKRLLLSLFQCTDYRDTVIKTLQRKFIRFTNTMKWKYLLLTDVDYVT